jgi:hypothetical protein
VKGELEGFWHPGCGRPLVEGDTAFFCIGGGEQVIEGCSPSCHHYCGDGIQYCVECAVKLGLKW